MDRRKSKCRKDLEAEEAIEAERNTITILSSIAKLEQGAAATSCNVSQSSKCSRQALQAAPAPLGSAVVTENGGTSSSYLQGSQRACKAIDAAQLESGRRRNSQEVSEHLEKEGRTATDVFSDRAPSSIDMDLLWKLQADHYKEFASRLNDGDARGPQVTVQRTSSQLFDGQDFSGPGVKSGMQTRPGRGQGGSSSGRISMFGREEEIKRAGPSRKSVRRAKKRTLDLGILSQDLPEDPEDPRSCEPELSKSSGAAQKPTATSVERRQDAELAPSPGLNQKQAEGPGPPKNQMVAEAVASGLISSSDAEVARAQGMVEGVEEHGDSCGVVKLPEQPSKASLFFGD